MEMESILDFSTPVDVQKFDQVVQYLSTGSQQEIMKAQKVLTDFKERPDAFLRVAPLLVGSENQMTRFFALQVLEEAILHRWNSFTESQCGEIRSLLVNTIVNECVSFSRIRSHKALLTKMNSALVSIAKREWPVRWPNFIQDICSSAGPTEPLVENNLNLLRIIGEDIFEFSEKTLTSRWIKRKKEALKSDFQLILGLCLSVLGTSDEVLLKADLECLEKYLSWMEPSLVFSEELLMYLAHLVTQGATVAPVATRCLAAVCSLETDPGGNGDLQAQLVVKVFRVAFNNILNALPTSHSSIEARVVHMHEMEANVDLGLIGDINLLLIAFLKRYTRLIVYDDALLIAANQMLVGMSSINNKELFKSCMEYWWWLGDKLVRSPGRSPLHTKLAQTLKSARYVFVKKMARPEEVIIVEEDGELRRERMTDVEEVQLYKLMKETMVFFTSLDPIGTQDILVRLVQKQINLSEWSWHSCSTLSWAVGSISMALPEEQENRLFVVFIRGLLDLCKDMEGKENRAVIASNIMFVVGQYPRFLRNHPSFLHAVVRKIVEFMRELFPGVQEMAVDTLLKVASQVPEAFVAVPNDRLSLASEIANHWTMITSMLKPEQTQTCFEAAGHIVKSETAAGQAALLNAFLQDENTNFKTLAERAAAQGAAFCQDCGSMLQLIHILRVFSSIAHTCGTSFISQMSLIIWDLQGLYRMFFSAQNSLLSEHGAEAMQQQEARHLRLAKKEILRIFERFVDNTEEYEFVAVHCMPSILTVVLGDYRDSLPVAKEPSVMALVTACIKKLGSRLAGDCAAILDHTFDTTVSMICTNTEDYPEFRINLFKLIQALNAHCFQAFLAYVSTKEEVVNGMLWVIKHTEFSIMETGLKTLDAFLENITNSEAMESFYCAFIQRVFVEVLVAAMDSLHNSGFELQCSILTKLFRVSAMFPAHQPAVGRDAVESFLLENLAVIGTLTPSLIKGFVAGCYECCSDELQFRRRFADFLIEMQVWGAEEENRLQREEERLLLEGAVPNFSETQANGQYNAIPHSW
ncbi:Importin beta N terminal domain [Trypanosoma vivax]|nr:Importin beta N terminal domain [Trypanosoma vivax]